MMEPLSCDSVVGRRSLRDRVAAACSLATIRSCFPILTWLPRYNLAWFRMDLLAGLTVGLTAVPQGLAYAEVAGLPVQVTECSRMSNSIRSSLIRTEGHITGDLTLPNLQWRTR